MPAAATIGPMAFNLDVELLDRLSEPVRDKKASSVSAIIRTALERYDFTNLVVLRTPQVFISVRLPADIRRNLKRLARAKHTSVSQLLRTAIEAYLPQLEAATAGQLEMPIVAPQPAQSALSAPTPAPRPKRKPRARRRAPVRPPVKKARKVMTKKRKG